MKWWKENEFLFYSSAFIDQCLNILSWWKWISCNQSQQQWELIWSSKSRRCFLFIECSFQKQKHKFFSFWSRNSDLIILFLSTDSVWKWLNEQQMNVIKRWSLLIVSANDATWFVLNLLKKKFITMEISLLYFFMKKTISNRSKHHWKSIAIVCVLIETVAMKWSHKENKSIECVFDVFWLSFSLFVFGELRMVWTMWFSLMFLSMI